MDPAEEYIYNIVKKHQKEKCYNNYGDTPVCKAYAGRTIFITGGSGFMGKQFLEKIFRSCNIKKAFVLLRPKKGKSITERLEILLNDCVFDEVRKIDSSFSSKLTAIEGDAKELRLGISDADWTMLVDQVEMIFHGAATINFVEHIRTATLINVRGTREIIQLARECKNLRALVHISTAYSQATKDRIDKEVLESFYENPISPHTLIQIAEESDKLDDDKMEEVQVILSKHWPNTYTFTKAVAEDLLQDATDISVSIIRPAIVINSSREPEPGWIDPSTLFGPSGLILGAGMGVLHVLYASNAARADMVPVDYVSNAIIAAGYAAMLRNQTKIYTLANTRHYALWSEKFDYMNKVIANYITPKAYWYSFQIGTDNEYMFTILNWLLHYIPGYVLDFIFQCFGKPPIFIKLYSKATKLVEVLSYFTKNNWKFEDKNTLELFNSLTVEDKQNFYFNIADLNWEEQMTLWGLGVRKYCVKDDLKGTEYGRKKQFYFRICHYLLTSFSLYSLWYISMLFLKYLFAVM